MSERTSTCHYEHSGGTFGFLICDSCDQAIVKDFRSRQASMKPPNYCSNCGCRITKRVKR